MEVHDELADPRYTVVDPTTSHSTLLGDQVWFSNPEDSYAVYLNREEHFTDQDAMSFIRRKRPDLYSRLFDSVSEQIACRAVSSNARIRSPSRGPTTPSKPDLRNELGTKSTSYINMTDYCEEHIPPMERVYLGLREKIIAALLKYHVFLLRKAPPVKRVFCSNPLCNRHGSKQRRLSPGTFYLAMKASTPEATQLVVSSSAVQCFCLTCVEFCFKFSQPNLGVTREPALGSTGHDGAGHNLNILEKTARLMPRANSLSAPCIGTDRLEAPDDSIELAETVHKRQLKDAETDEILAYLERCDSKTDRTTADESPTLIIFPRTDAPPEGRFKMQGRTPYDKWGRPYYERRKTSSESEKSAKDRREHSVPKSEPVELFCYCLEPGDGRELIACSSKNCIVGWVHLECSGLEQLPTKGQAWFCRYCSDIFSHAEAQSSDNLDEDDSDAFGEDTTETEEDADFENNQSATESPKTPDATIDGGTEQSPTEPTTPNTINQIEEWRKHTPPHFLDGPASPRVFNYSYPSSSPRNTRCVSSAAKAEAELVSKSPLPDDALQRPPSLAFIDIAPFIFAELDASPYDLCGITQDHLTALEHWKSLCPPSRLLYPDPKADQPSASIPLHAGPTNHLASVEQSPTNSCAPVPTSSNRPGETTTPQKRKARGTQYAAEDPPPIVNSRHSSITTPAQNSSSSGRASPVPNLSMVMAEVERQLDERDARAAQRMMENEEFSVPG